MLFPEIVFGMINALCHGQAFDIYQGYVSGEDPLQSFSISSTDKVYPV